ncbi:MAG: histidinol dehydrogenase [Treponema sp.]|jgi:histidinol dehydrogenase|nr:histidinol dehydrogenase [Treponema sp.]
MKVIPAEEFDGYWRSLSSNRAGPGQTGPGRGDPAEAAVQEIIAAVGAEGDRALRRYAALFDRSSPEKLEVDAPLAREAWRDLKAGEPELAAAMELAAAHIRRFSLEQKKQFVDFEYEMEEGLVTGQRVIPVERAAVYAPGGRFPLVSTVLMGLIPGCVAGVGELVLASPPGADGLPDRRILAAAALAGDLGGIFPRIFSMGGAQAIAALALGTETVPRCDLIAGPGNKYVAAAKRLLYGRTGIDFIAGPTDVLIIAGAAFAASFPGAADLIAADMLAQAEHDGDARARVLVPQASGAALIAGILDALERRLALLPTAAVARASLDAGGLIVSYRDREEAVRIANTIAPEHLELLAEGPESWAGGLKNYGSLFLGPLSAEALGDYSAGINHTLPTSGSARFTGGLSVRHFLKTLTTLRCVPGPGFEAARRAAEIMAGAENLPGHARSAAARSPGTAPPPVPGRETPREPGC